MTFVVTVKCQLKLLKLIFILSFQGASSFKEAMRMGAEIYQNLKKVVKSRYGIDGE